MPFNEKLCRVQYKDPDKSIVQYRSLKHPEIFRVLQAFKQQIVKRGGSPLFGI